MNLTQQAKDLLTRLADAPSSSQALALRARTVLLTDEHSVADVARTLNVSRNTVVKWRARFDELGVEGLGDRSRPGRPATVGVDKRDAVLGLQLREPPGGTWTTRVIAEELGMSQTAVSRVRRQWFTERRGLITRSVFTASGHLVLAAVLVSPGACALVLHQPATPAGFTRSQPATGSTRRMTEAVRTVLVAQHGFKADKRNPEPSERVPILDVLGQVDRGVPADRKIVALVDTTITAEVRRWLSRHPRCSVYEVAASRWLSQLDSIAEVLDRRQEQHLVEIEHQLRTWAHHMDGPFRWVRPTRLDDAPQPATPKARGRATPSSPPRLATAVVTALRESIATGSFRAGERIAEEPLAARLGVSRGPIRDALQILAEDGLVALEPHRGAYIPVPTYQDIFDTYTARGPLGALLLRRVASTQPDLAPLETALAEIVRYANAHDAPGAGHADIRWQDTAAGAADMPRIEKMFVRLSLQLRMFVSILGLEYAYSVDDIVADDTAMLDALRDGDPDLVTTLWSRKIDNAVRNMVEQFRHLGVSDADLSARR